MGDYEKSFHLLCPGPVNVRPEVARALTAFEFCHREEEFTALLRDVQAKALELSGADPDVWEALVVTGSGTAGNESVLSTAVGPDERVLVLSNGEFGQRLAGISRVYNETDELAQAWGEPIDLERFASYLHSHKVGLVAMVHHETSTGVLNPVEAVSAICRLHGVRLFADMVSSWSADPLELSALTEADGEGGLTFMTTSSGKAIAAYPGLALVIGRRDAFEALGALPVRNHYLNLYRHYRFSVDAGQTPNTPAVPLILALNAALDVAVSEGREGRHARMARLARHVRRGLRARGLAVMFEEQRLSSVVTSARMPVGVVFEQLRLALREEGFVIYGGKGPLAGEIFQVSTISDIDELVIDRFFAALDRVVARLRRDVAEAASRA